MAESIIEIQRAIDPGRIAIIVKETIQTVYPQYYPAGAVRFFLNLHSEEQIKAALEKEKIYFITADGIPAGTGSIRRNEICRLFVLPAYQKKGYGSNTRSLLMRELKQLTGISSAITRWRKKARLCWREKMIYELSRPQKAAILFQGWQETSIWSCLQGVMGKIYADSLENPASAAAVLGDFCFLAGRPAKELVCRKAAAKWRDFMILVPQHQGWADLIESCYGKQANKVTRYAFKKEPDVFDRKKLQKAIDGLPDGYSLKRMDEALFWQCRNTEWCRDWVLQYADYTAYEKYGLGAVILKDNEPVSGASSYSGYLGGIEVEIDTREDFRRKGLAYICGAKLVLECLRRDWYPSWDAQNPWSAALAEKLGYHRDHAYAAYEILCK